jgi:hypothetical protein
LSVSDTPLLGTTRLSGTTAVILSNQDYVVEHKMPAMEGGLVEREGRIQKRVDVHGFLYSGADDQYRALVSGARTTQTFSVPSTVPGNNFYSGVVNVEDIRFYSVPGKGYSYYAFRLRGVETTLSPIIPASGTVIATASGTQLPWQSVTFANGRWWIWFVSKFNTAGVASYPQIGYVSSPDGLTWSAPTIAWSLPSGSFASTPIQMLTCVQLIGTKFYYSVAATTMFSASISGNNFVWSQGTMNSDGTTTFTITNSDKIVTNPVNFASYINADASGGVWVCVTYENAGLNTFNEVWLYSGNTWGDKTGALNSGTIVSGNQGSMGRPTNLVGNTDGTAFLWTMDDVIGGGANTSYYFVYSGGSWGELTFQSGFQIGSNNPDGAVILNNAVVVSGANYALDAAAQQWLTRPANSGYTIDNLTDSAGNFVFFNPDPSAITFLGGVFYVFAVDSLGPKFGVAKSTSYGASGQWIDQVKISGGPTNFSNVALRSQYAPSNGYVGLAWVNVLTENQVHFMATPA